MDCYYIMLDLKVQAGNEFRTFIRQLNDAVEVYWDKFVFAMPKIVIGIIVLLLAIFIAAQISKLIIRRLRPKTNDPLLLVFIAKITKIIIIIFGFIFALQVIGFKGIAGGILATAGLSAFVIGFAFKDIGENFLAGFILAFKRPFRINDTIMVNDFTGNVKELNLRDTQVKTFDGKDIFIPNAVILKNPLVNFTLDGHNRIEFNITIDYDDDFGKACTIITGSLQGIEGLVKDRPPFVVIHEFHEKFVILRVILWIYTYDYKRSEPTIKSDAMDRVKKTLTEAGFGISPRIRGEIEQGKK